jgi:hypothetical protein
VTPGSRAVRDVVAVVFIAVAGFVVGSRVAAGHAAVVTPFFGQTEFAPAVMLTCGREFARPRVSPPALDDFLALKTDTFSCDQLTPAMTPNGVNVTQGLYRYLMTAVAWQWKWSGISWRALSTLSGIIFAVTLCAAYGLFRLGAGPALACAAVVPLALSTHHLAFTSELRDYAKAPFMLVLLLILGRLVMPPFERRRALLLATAFGVVLGIGFGFRNDLLINIPPLVFCLFFVVPGRWRDHLKLKAACLAVAALTFAVAALPILRAYQSGSNTGHVVVLGLTSAFDRSLGVTRPVYDIGPHYLDGYAAALINIYSRLQGGPFVRFLSPEYDRASAGLAGTIARHWPADIAVRGLAATVRVLEFPFSVNTLSPSPPQAGESARILRFYADWQEPFLRGLQGWPVWLALASLLIIAASSPRVGFALALLLLYYAGYPATQFSLRHYFHLEFIAWWALVFAVASIAQGVRTLAEGKWPAMTAMTVPARNAALTASALAALVLGPLTILRVYQQRHVATLLEGYRQAHRSPLTLSTAPRAGDVTRVTVDGLWTGHQAGDPFDARYLAAGFSADRCSAASVPVTLRYDAQTPANDLSYTKSMTISRGGPTEWLVPAYYLGSYGYFAGFELPAGLESCLTSVSRIDGPTSLPLLLDLQLAPGWQNTSLFQRLAKWESAR